MKIFVSHIHTHWGDSVDKMTHSVEVSQSLSLCGFPMAVKRIDFVQGQWLCTGSVAWTLTYPHQYSSSDSECVIFLQQRTKLSLQYDINPRRPAGHPRLCWSHRCFPWRKVQDFITAKQILTLQQIKCDKKLMLIKLINFTMSPDIMPKWTFRESVMAPDVWQHLESLG